MKEVTFIIIGWLLGILTNYFSYIYTRRDRIINFKKGIESELIHILELLVITRMLSLEQCGKKDLESHRWMESILSDLPNTRLSMETIKKLSELTSEEYNKIVKYQRATSIGTTKDIKKLSLDYLDSNLNLVGYLDREAQLKIFEIRRRIDLINQLIDRYDFYFSKTFEPQIMDVNAKIIKENINGIFDSIATQAKYCIDEINHLRNILKKQKLCMTNKCCKIRESNMGK